MSAISMGASSPGSASAWSSIGEAAMVAVERAEAATEWRAGAAMVEVEGSATVDGYISIATIRDVLATSDSAIVVRASASPASRL
jgi:hypothetical protein